jgi:hypothetical protein
MTILRTLPNLIAQSKPDTVNCRDIKDLVGRTGYERYWKVATLMHPRESCSTIWVVGIKHDHSTEWIASTSIGVIKALHVALKLWGSDDARLSFVIIEPLGTLFHKVKPSNIAPAIAALDIKIVFSDPNQRSLFDITPTTGEPVIKL